MIEPLLVRARAPRSTLVLGIAAVLIAAASWQTVSLAAGAGIDPSWRVALHLTWTRGVAFGDAFTWTYGPLGFLVFPIGVDGGTLAAAFVFLLAAQLALCWLLLRRAFPAYGLLAPVVVYLAVALPVAPPDLLLLVEVVLAVIALESEAAPWFPVAGGIVAALGALTKTNSGAASVAILLVVAAALGLRLLAFAAGVVVAAFAVGWLAAGQQLADVAGWLRLSAAIVSGYSAAMQYEQQGLHYEYVVAGVVVALVLAAAALAARRLSRGRGLALVLVYAALSFAMFKEGFVRHDAAHSASFFAAVAVGAVALARRGATAVLAVAVVVLAVWATHRSHQLAYAPVSDVRRVATQAADVTVAGRRHRVVVASRTAERRSYGLPDRVVAALRGHTVHVDPTETAVVAAYGLRWRPLPVVQAYSAYTSTLDERNADALGGAAAPARVLRESTHETVNGRGRELEAPAEFRALLCDYRQVLATAKWQVIERTAGRCGAPHVLGVATAPHDSVVPVPDAPLGDLVIARIRVPGSAANAVRGLLYKPRTPFVSLSGGPYTPLVAATAGDGIVVHVPGSAGFDPRFGGAIDWRSVAVGGPVGTATIEFDAVPFHAVGPPPAGARPARSLPPYRLTARGIRTPAGATLPLATAGGGFVDSVVTRRGDLELAGWAADAQAGTPARVVLVFADGRLVYAAPPNVRRPDVARALKQPGLARAGYVVDLPLGRVLDGVHRRHLRIVSVVGGRALETTYETSYGWR